MNTVKTQSASHQYVLGHSPDELERLIRQSGFFNWTTGEVLRQAGLRAGMHVVDVGCGAGDVALLAAEIVGPRGSVTAIDRSPEALALAEYRAGQMNLGNISFLEADLNEYQSDMPIDAVVGRLVLLYQKDPAATLRHLRRSLKPGGLLVFQEFNMDLARSWPTHDFYERIIDFLRRIFIKAGMDTALGVRLYQHMKDAGLSRPKAVAHQILVLGDNLPESVEYFVHTVRSLLPAAQQLGVPAPEDLDLDTLAQRLRDESERDRVVYTMAMMVGAWGVSG
jgi:ubiquinone/menaquinone biosynthesis C-methylase UbiE